MAAGNLREYILITGATSKLGGHIARYLHSKGKSLILHYRSPGDKLEKLRRELSLETDSVFFLKADLTDSGHRASIINFLKENNITLKGIIHNAGIFYPTPFGKISKEDFYRFFNMNTLVPFQFTRELLPFLKQTAESCVVNLVDIYGFRPIKNYLPYCVSKSALISLTLALAKELAPVRVNGVAPGAIEFPENYSEEQMRKIVGNTLLKEKGNPEHIAMTVEFLLNNTYITGQIIKVDGGKMIL